MKLFADYEKVSILQIFDEELCRNVDFTYKEYFISMILMKNAFDKMNSAVQQNVAKHQQN